MISSFPLNVKKRRGRCLQHSVVATVKPPWLSAGVNLSLVLAMRLWYGCDVCMLVQCQIPKNWCVPCASNMSLKPDRTRNYGWIFVLQHQVCSRCRMRTQTQSTSSILSKCENMHSETRNLYPILPDVHKSLFNNGDNRRLFLIMYCVKL